MPRMSIEDETLMWEILDFGSSSEGCKLNKFSDLAIPCPDTTNGHGQTGNDMPTAVEGTSEEPEKADQRRSTAHNVRDLSLIHI